MQIAPGTESAYAAWKAKNSDAYSAACFLFAEQWAEAMEKAMEGTQRPAVQVVPAVADETMREVDRRPGFGITGFMYGAVVSILARHWLHGEVLRRWHNKETQLGDEGDRANEKPGAVLNPALLTFGTKGA